MLKKTFEFEDYDGNKRVEDHYFNLNKAEVIKWLTTTGDYTLDQVLERLSKERNGEKIMEIFEGLIHMSYGRKSLDGRKFEKSEEIWEDFYRTEAYSNLFIELVTDPNKAADFVNKIIPESLSKDVEKTIKEHPELIPEAVRNSGTTLVSGS